MTLFVLLAALQLARRVITAIILQLPVSSAQGAPRLHVFFWVLTRSLTCPPSRADYFLAREHYLCQAQLTARGHKGHWPFTCTCQLTSK